MKNTLILGIALIVIGAAIIGYRQFSYSSRETVLDIGPIKATAETTKTDSITAPDMVAQKLPQTVEIKDIGPCKKHVKVTIEESAIRARFDEKYSDLVLKATGFVPGFRPGKAPRKIVEKRYKKEVSAKRDYPSG